MAQIHTILKISEVLPSMKNFDFIFSLAFSIKNSHDEIAGFQLALIFFLFNFNFDIQPQAFYFLSVSNIWIHKVSLMNYCFVTIADVI